MREVSEGEGHGGSAEDDDQDPGGGGPLGARCLLRKAQQGHFVDHAFVKIYRTGFTWRYWCLSGEQLGSQGGGDGEDDDDHHRGRDATATGRPLARGRVGHVWGWLVLGNWNCLSPSDCLKWF